jgi:2-(1,2-epoxy-1,2-dihydrophenyl)acetyl-CoA isomerase
MLVTAILGRHLLVVAKQVIINIWLCQHLPNTLSTAVLGEDMSPLVLVERRDAVAVVTMNRPNKRNALNKDLCVRIAETLDELRDDPGVRALVLFGGKHFCAGGDLAELDAPALEMRQSMYVGHRIIRELAGGRLPVVAAVEGNAYGAGFSMALACDFVVADEATTFCAAFARVGLQPDYGILRSLTQRVGIGVAREIVMLGEPISGRLAKDRGLVDRLSEPGKVFDTAVELAIRLAAAPPGTIAATKAVIYRQPLTLDTMLAWEADTQSLLTRSEDFVEGVNAFAQKRPPTFKGR